MAVCRNCGKESARIRTTFTDNGPIDECSFCKQESFDSKVTVPSDQKIWMGYEAHPEQYTKAADGGYDRKPEYRAEQEARLSQESEEEKEKRLRAEAKKRRERRTMEMNPAEQLAALAKARQYADFIEGGVDIVH